MSIELRSMTMLTVGILFLTSLDIFGASPPSSDAQGTKDAPPKSETFSQDTVPNPTWNGIYHLSGVSQENGRIVSTGLTLSWSRMIDRNTSESVSITYKRLGIGDIVPIFTALYRVAEADPEENWITVKRIDDHKLLGELGIDPDSNVLPFKAGVQLRGVKFHVESLTDGKGEKPVPTAHVHTSYAVPTETIIWKSIERAYRNLRAGDTIEVADSKYKVRKIIPVDAKRQIIGWVELTPIREVRTDRDERRHQE